MDIGNEAVLEGFKLIKLAVEKQQECTKATCEEFNRGRIFGLVVIRKVKVICEKEVAKLNAGRARSEGEVGRASKVASQH